MELNNQNMYYYFIIITKLGQICTSLSNNDVQETQCVEERGKLRHGDSVTEITQVLQ